MLRENGYIDEDAPVIYVLDNCSSKVIPYCKGKIVYEVTVGKEDDECDYDDCDDCEEEFTVNGRPVSKEEFDKKYEEFEEMYLDNIRDMLLNYCSFMDEVNDWKSRFLRW